MATPIKEIVERIDDMMAAALPADHSAPLGPVIEAGCYLTRVWPTMRKKLMENEPPFKAPPPEGVDELRRKLAEAIAAQANVSCG